MAAIQACGGGGTHVTGAPLAVCALEIDATCWRGGGGAAPLSAEVAFRRRRASGADADAAAACFDTGGEELILKALTEALMCD